MNAAKNLDDSRVQKARGQRPQDDIATQPLPDTWG